jgi:hypothetical protein
MIDSLDSVAQQLADLLTYSNHPGVGAIDNKAKPSLGNHANARILLHPERFRQLNPSSPPWRTLAVDASLKSILDCGAFVVVLIKAAFEVWQLGSRRVKEGIETHVEIIRTLEAARQKMGILEVELASKATSHLSEGDVALLDRPLCLPSRPSPRFKQSLEHLASNLKAERVGLLGVCKSSRLGIEGGAPLIGYLLHYASTVGINGSWFYFPLAEAGAPYALRIGQPCVAALNANEDFAFRIDLASNISNADSAGQLLGSVAALGDRFAYGYPYPLRSVHEACAISRTEVDICRQRLLEAASRRGVYRNLRYALKATSFREEVLLS